MSAVPELDVSTPTSGRLVLRGWQLTDIDVVLRAAQDSDIARYSTVGSARTMLDAEQWISARDEPDRLDWAVTTSNVIVGRVSLARIDQTDALAEVGYWLLPEHRGKGIASAAVGAAEQHAFEVLSLARLVIRHEPENQRSCLLAQRRGYLEEGTQRSVFAHLGRRRDLHVHARLATDPPAR